MKTKLTPELQKEFCSYVAAGITKKGACEACFITESALYDWIQKGERAKAEGKTTIYSEFAESVKKAEAKFKLSHIKNIKNAAESGNWQASAWMLERVCRDEYGKKERVEVTGKDEKPVEVESRVQIYIPDNGRE